jgi:hypothetical protein
MQTEPAPLGVGVQELDDSKYQADGRCRLGDPNAEDPADQTSLESANGCLEPRVHSDEPYLHLGPQLGEPALPFGILLGEALFNLAIRAFLANRVLVVTILG